VKLLIGIVILSASCVGCARSADESFASVPAQREMLLGGLKSYSAPEEVRTAMAALKWQVLEDSGGSPRDSRPAFHVLTLVVSPFKDHGCVGELRLEFFNRRLMSTWFYPEDPSAYRAAVQPFPATGVVGGELRSPRLRVWSASDYRKRVYFAWCDERLLREQERWIEKFA